MRNDKGEVTNYSGIFYDISERKSAEARLHRLAHFDSLTELPNRQSLHDKLQLACQLSAANQERFAVLFIDLDRFKEVNDTLGHHAGDLLLRETGHRLREVLRSQDMAARIGGDEFAVLLDDLKSPANAAMIAQKIIDALQQPVTIELETLCITPSIGIALCPDHAQDPGTLLRLADKAMYRAKAAGRNTYRFYEN